MAVSLRSRLPEIAAELRPRVSAAIKAGAARIAVTAAAYAPVLRTATSDRVPRELSRSIRSARRGAASYAVEVTVQDERGLYWGWFQEFGWRYGPAQPYLLPATEHEERAIVAGVEFVTRSL